MHDRCLRILRACALVASAACLPGCLAVAVAAGAAAAYGAVKYSDNAAYAEYAEDANTVWNASLVSLQKHGYPVSTGVDRVAAGGEVSINDVELHVLPVASEVTRVTVRVGTFSTEEHRLRAAAILNDITSELN